MKSFWKLIVKCVCVMMPFIVLGCWMGKNPLAYVDGEAPYYIWNKETSNMNQEKRYRVVVLGDSTANASYVPEVLSRDTINLSLGGTTPLTNYFTLRDWLEHNPAPDVCYISFMDFHLQREDCFWTRTMYSHRCSLPQNLEMMIKAVAYQESSILTEHSWLDYVSYQLYLPNKYITSFMNASFNQRYEGNSNAVKAIDLHEGRYLGRGTNEYVATDPVIFDEFRINPLFDEYYRKIIELCIENGITLRVVKLPLADNCQYTEHYEETFDKYYENLQREYPSITVDRFSLYPKNQFTDTHHMNSHGALRFSTELKKLHPEDFSTTEMDDRQIAAIDDSIRGENKIEWILKWIDGKDYTVLFYDKRGEFGDLYEDRLKDEWGTGRFHLMDVPIEEAAKRKPDVWAVSGTEDGALTASSTSAFAPLSVSLAGNGLSLQLEGKEPQEWATASDDMLGVAVVNNYNNAVVCMKSFRYVDEEFQLAQ